MRPANYFADTLPESLTILGVRLLPLSAGHLIRLHQVESPFVLGSQPTIEDLIRAVLICSKTWCNNSMLLSCPQLPRMIAKWRRRLMGGWFRKRPINWPEKFALFQLYFDQHTQIPNVKSAVNESRKTNCPMVLMVMNELETKTNWRRCELLDRPWLETLWDWLTVKVLDEKVDRFVSADDVDDTAAALAAANAAYEALNGTRSLS